MLLKRLVTVAPIRFNGPQGSDLEASATRELDFNPDDEVVYLRENGEVRLIIPRDAILCMEPLPKKEVKSEPPPQKYKK